MISLKLICEKSIRSFHAEKTIKFADTSLANAPQAVPSCPKVFSSL